MEHNAADKVWNDTKSCVQHKGLHHYKYLGVFGAFVHVLSVPVQLQNKHEDVYRCLETFLKVKECLDDTITCHPKYRLFQKRELVL